MTDQFDPTSLQQSWPTPEKPRPIVIFGAGSIVGDAHLPAYRKAGLPVAGIFDPDVKKAASLAAEWGIRAFATETEALAIPDAIFDLATPPAAHAAILSKLPVGSGALIQKPMGADLAAATEILNICRDRQLQAAVNFQLRFAPMMLALRDAIEKAISARSSTSMRGLHLPRPGVSGRSSKGCRGSRSPCTRSIIST